MDTLSKDEKQFRKEAYKRQGKTYRRMHDDWKETMCHEITYYNVIDRYPHSYINFNSHSYFSLNKAKNWEFLQNPDVPIFCLYTRGQGRSFQRFAVVKHLDKFYPICIHDGASFGYSKQNRKNARKMHSLVQLNPSHRHGKYDKWRRFPVPTEEGNTLKAGPFVLPISRPEEEMKEEEFERNRKKRRRKFQQKMGEIPSDDEDDGKPICDDVILPGVVLPFGSIKNRFLLNSSEFPMRHLCKDYERSKFRKLYEKTVHKKRQEKYSQARCIDFSLFEEKKW